MIVERGYAKAGDFHTARLQEAPIGHFFDVMTNGYGAMPDYSAQLTVADRWAVAAYIRALQLSQNAKSSDVAAGEQVQTLSNIAQSEGLPANFVAEWTLPATAVTGTPNDQDFVIPPAQAVPGAGKAPASSTPQPKPSQQ